MSRRPPAKRPEPPATFLADFVGGCFLIAFCVLVAAAAAVALSLGLS